MSDPTLWPAHEQAAAIAARQLGSEELLDLFVERIDRVDQAVNAVCTRAFDTARARCRAADRATLAGESWGPLHGLPFTVKDAIATAGVRSTGGAESLREHVPASDAPAVAALKAAGAIVFGKTNLPEWSGDWQSWNTVFGTTNNPWDLTRTPGGSSGGAAAAVACGMTAFELGTDIGGSVRVPSAFCGVFGLKPTWGVVPTYGYLDEPGGGITESDVNVFGPIARSAADLALLLDVLADARRGMLEPDRDSLADGLRIAAWIDDAALVVDSAVGEVLHRAVATIESNGIAVDRAARPAIDAAASARNGTVLIGAAVSISSPDDRGFTHRQWLERDRQRARDRLAWAEFFGRFDVLLCPVMPVTAFEHLQEGHWTTRRIAIDGVDHPYLDLELWPALIGAAYLPSVSTPVGFTAGGLPVGVQVVAAHGHDRAAIRLAGWLAEQCGGYVPPPIVTGAT